MCTVSWLVDDTGYELFCNRDEKRTRALATGPEFKTQDSVRTLSPTDGEAGGTWIGTNEFGISLCLLNGPAIRSHARQSRGLILPGLLSSQSVAEVCERSRRVDFDAFAPFTLAVLTPGHGATLLQWDGWEQTTLSYGDVFVPLTSSSYDPEGVRSRRRDEFRQNLRAAGKVDSEALLAFHSSHGCGPDAYSPCMHRPDAETVSFSWVRVGPSSVEFIYRPGPLCQSSVQLRRTLSLRKPQ